MDIANFKTLYARYAGVFRLIFKLFHRFHHGRSSCSVLLTRQSTVVWMIRPLVAQCVMRPLTLHRKRFHRIIRSFGIRIILFSCEPPSLLLPFDAIQRRPSNDRTRGASHRTGSLPLCQRHKDRHLLGNAWHQRESLVAPRSLCGSSLTRKQSGYVVGSPVIHR
jgi:hypothetical protein